MKVWILTLLAAVSTAQRNPWMDQWEEEHRNERQQNKENEKRNRMIEEQRGRYDGFMSWYDAPVQQVQDNLQDSMLGSSDIEMDERERERQRKKQEKSNKKKKELDEWGQMRQSLRDSGYQGKKLDAESLFYAGRSHSGYSSGGEVDMWGDSYETDFDEMMDQMKETGEKWGPRQWFEAGKEWSQSHPDPEPENQPVVQPVVQPFFDESPGPSVYQDNQSSDLFFDDEPIKIYDDYMLGADYDEYDMYEDNYMRPEERYWDEPERDENYVPSAWEQRNMFRQHYNSYATTIPSWNDFMPEETQQSIDDFRSGYSGKKAWYKSKEFNVDLSGLQNAWFDQLNTWDQNRPTWDSWSQEQGW